MRRRTVIGIILALLAAVGLLAGCGESSDYQGTVPAQTSQEPLPEQEYDLSATSQAVTQQLGGNGAAAYAVLKAADNGYSPYQIAAAINAGLLDGGGVIQGMTPARPAGDTISRSGGTTRFAVASATSATTLFAAGDADPSSRSELEQLFQGISDPQLADRWLVWVLGATGAGYSAQQITQYLGASGTPQKPAAPLWGGVPVLFGDDGKVAAPELEPDWAYRGRSMLRDLQQDPDLDFDDTVTILIIGMVNAGYSQEQIEAALTQHDVVTKTSTIGLCTTADGSAVTVGWVDANGQVVPPAAATPGAYPPGRVLIADVTPYWPTHTGSATASPAEDDVAKYNSGQTVTLRLTPYFARKDTGMVITAHEVLLTLAPSSSSDSAVITCRWTIEITQETDAGKWAPGTRFVLRGEAWDKDGGSQWLRSWQKMDYSASYAEYSPTGEQGYTYNDAGTGFSGSLNEYLEGEGTLPGGPAAINWDTFPGVGAGGQ